MEHAQRILVVDDNLMNREIIKEMLGDEYDVIMAADGPESIVLAEQYRPRIVLLDVMLPGMDGYTICRKLRSMPEASTSWIVMVTAKAMLSERAQGFEAGADAYITKPFDETELFSAIRPANRVHVAAR